MTRSWNSRDFDKVYERWICQEEFGQPEYYSRYRSRYKECMKRFGELVPSRPADVLDIGGGSLAIIAAKLWNDRGVVADLPGPHLDHLAGFGVDTISWNICTSDPPLDAKFDCIFFSEVIEHLPMPGYLVLQRIAKALRPGGVLICTTPNLYRLKNVVNMALGNRIFDYFQYPDEDTSLGHVLEYGRDHLDWHFKKAGFTNYKVELVQFHHMPTNPIHRPLALLGYPLHIIPRWRDYLLAIGYAPTRSASEQPVPAQATAYATQEKA
jgi:2-polyprenyl-3-methyl-5-hydroxy-6-metoxy-1,4-benzoquinol methylase